MNTARMRETAEAVESSVDNGRLERFRAGLDGPLVVVASGGSYTTALLWAHLHESAGFSASAMTPYAFSERELPAGTRVLFLSAGGHHHDILRTVDWSVRRGHRVRAVTCRSASPLAARVARAGNDDAVFVAREPRHRDGLIAVHGLVALAIVAARMYAGIGPWASCFDVESASLPLAQPRFVVAFGAGAAEPAAVDFANKCQEAGVAPAWQTDLRHFSHGQWMMLHGGAADMLLVAFASRSQREYLERFTAVLPPAIPFCRVVAETDGVAAALELLARAMRTFEDLAARGRGAPSIEAIPAWCRGLYELEL